MLRNNLALIQVVQMEAVVYLKEKGRSLSNKNVKISCCPWDTVKLEQKSS